MRLNEPDKVGRQKQLGVSGTAPEPRLLPAPGLIRETGAADEELFSS